MTEHIDLTPYFAAASGVLHNLYFHKPNAELLAPWLNGEMTSSWPQFGTGSQLAEALTLIEHSLAQDPLACIEQDYYHLFIGPGQMAAYPWGSVYTDQENLLFGATAQAFAAFLPRWQVDVTLESHQPLDHIGIILAALSQLLANQQWAAVDELLTEHLMPWAPRFLQCIEQAAQTDFYRGLAQLTAQLLNALMAERQLTASQLPLYK